MNIEEKRPDFAPALDRVDQGKTADSAAVDRSKAWTDQIHVSAETQLVNEASAWPSTRPRLAWRLWDGRRSGKSAVER
jgi:hypothetical protein